MRRKWKGVAQPLALATALMASTVETASAQEISRRSEASAWGGLMTSWSLSPDWAVWFDTHYNTDSFLVVRGGLTRRLSSGLRLTGGYAHLLLSDGDSLGRNEFRPWAQLFIPVALDGPWAFSERIRTDFRLRERLGPDAEGVAFTFRLRLQSALTLDLADAPWGVPFVQAADEVLVNLAGEAGPNFLDQNRVSAMLGLRRRAFTVRVGYLYRFLPSDTGLRRTHEHNAVVWLNYRFHPKASSSGEGANP